jgi:hypothetical protein
MSSHQDAADRLLKQALGLRIDARRGLVQDENARVHQQDARKGEKLLLAHELVRAQ